MHEEMANGGEARIAALIQEMHPGVPAEEGRFAAKTIQRLITGALIETCAERIRPDAAKIREHTVRASLIMADSVATG